MKNITCNGVENFIVLHIKFVSFVFCLFLLADRLMPFTRGLVEIVKYYCMSTVSIIALCSLG